MGASRKQGRIVRYKRRAKDDLINVSPARGAGFTSDFSANGSNLADLFLHRRPPCRELFPMPHPFRAGDIRIGEIMGAENTVEVGVP